MHRGRDHRPDLLVPGVQRHRHLPVACTEVPADPVNRKIHGTVPVIRRHDLSTALRRHGAQRDPDALGRVGDQSRTFRGRPHRLGDVAADMGEPVVEPPAVEAVGVGRHFVPEALLGALHGDRHSADRTMVEVTNGRIQGEQQPGADDRFGWGDHGSMVCASRRRWPTNR